jgi:flagellar basal body P-ring formation protein FlgA
MRLASFLHVKQSDSKPSTWSARSRRRRLRTRAQALAGAALALALALPVLAAAAGNGSGTASGSADVRAAAPAARFQSLEALARRAEEALRDALPTQPLSATVAPATLPQATHRIAARVPDPRLRLAACPTPLDATLPVSVGGLRARTIVQVSCKSPSSRWTVLVPVVLQTEATVLVATRSLSRGQAPQAGDVQITQRTLPGISSFYISNLNEIRNQHLIRPLAAGQPLTRDALATDPVVRRGEAVTLVADVVGVEVRMPGRALADARPGQPVRVQNVNSLKIVEGRADDQGVVRVDR